jgi:hypothetical protein
VFIIAEIPTVEGKISLTYAHKVSEVPHTVAMVDASSQC